ncbi:hypothetical protein [Streptomyces europaeiscabiei]|uniref:hypothetical protein n=1 Tax=Streptomyces europaeiscabiei TaxID=146819 RepID=UPI002E0E26FB|nr:hypothetical protein OHB30_43050 [Streptomyces europaeiscabiei]
MQAGAVLDGRYRLIEPVGAGGFGQVWAAHDPKVDRLVAVKVLSEDGSADRDRQVARFAREAAVAGGLSRPNIVTVHDFGSPVIATNAATPWPTWTTNAALLTEWALVQVLASARGAPRRAGYSRRARSSGAGWYRVTYGWPL